MASANKRICFSYQLISFPTVYQGELGPREIVNLRRVKQRSTKTSVFHTALLFIKNYQQHGGGLTVLTSTWHLTSAYCIIIAANLANTKLATVTLAYVSCSFPNRKAQISAWGVYKGSNLGKKTPTGIKFGIWTEKFGNFAFPNHRFFFFFQFQAVNYLPLGQWLVDDR